MRIAGSLSNKTCHLAALILAGVVVSAANSGEPSTVWHEEGFKQEVEKIAQALNYKDGLRIHRIMLNSRPVSSAILWRTTWRLRSYPQSRDLSTQMESAAMKLPEADRLKSMNRFDDHIQVWGVAQPAKAGPDGKAGLIPADVPHRQHRELFYLGGDKNFAWYGLMPIYDFVFLEQKLLLKGEDVLPALVRGMAVEDLGGCTANSCQGLLGQEGAGALKAIDNTIADRLPQRARLVGAMSSSRDAAVTRWLINLVASTDAEVARAARQTLLWSPRAEAAPLYVKWLAEGVGQREVAQELRACREVRATQATLLLPKVLAAPASVHEYRQALEMSHERAGKPAIRQDLLAAEKQIQEFGYGSGPRFDQKKVDEAVNTILAAGAPEDAAAVGMSLAIYTTKGDTRAIRQAGVEILRRLPGGEGKRLANLLERTNRSWQAEAVKAVARAVDSR
jgi:hypothetical protein